MKKTMKIFGIGAAILMILVVLTPACSATTVEECEDDYHDCLASIDCPWWHIICWILEISKCKAELELCLCELD